ncbi:MAG: response regulator [Melioribacteraceae bacterium]
MKAMKKLLIFEDDVLNQNLYQTLFKDEYQTAIYSSFEKFIEDNLDWDFDAVIMDLSLKGNHDGIQIMQYLRSNEKFKNLPIICITAHAFLKDKENCMRNGADAYIAKPCTKKTIFSALEKCITERK